MLHILPERIGSAAENMATDLLLLRRYPEARVARFRAYGWHRPAFTFGYSQKIAWVRAAVAARVGDDPVELCRRPSGGGLVDHRADWTYALVVPRGHALEAARAAESYRAIHQALADAFVACGQPAARNDRCPRPNPCASSPDEAPPTAAVAGVCFDAPELDDVIDPATRRKIAGAAQKRTKEGLLLQGSIARAAVRADMDWGELAVAFTTALGNMLGLDATEHGWPDFPEGELDALTESYASPEWVDLR